MLRVKVLTELHETHPGISRMKALARCYVWWPGIDGEIESMVQQCETCQRNQRSPVAAPIHPWEYPSSPWERIHIDHAGPVDGKLFLIVVDSYSKWVEAELVSSTSAEVTIRVLRRLFAAHGLPHTLVSDNATGFVGEEMKAFLLKNGVRHLNSAPYHPASNGQAEIIVRKVKESLKSMKKGDIETQLQRILFKDRITPSTTTGFSPAELLLNRRLRSALTLLRPESQVKTRQASAVPGRRTRTFRIGDPVVARSYGRGEHWLDGVVSEVMGATDYQVLLTDGRTIHRHIDQLKFRYRSAERSEPLDLDEPLSNPEHGTDLSGIDGGREPEAIEDPVMGSSQAVVADAEDVMISTPAVHSPAPVVESEPATEPRRSLRERRPPERFRDGQL